tara:strand:- start:3825 stop:4346 length:522 start_codon:yes stop_codon:yes gene_type:complete
MAGTGQGMLQPTKLILTDDFHENLALPGYQGQLKSIASDIAYTDDTSKLFVVPDGCTVELMDVGFTFPYGFTFTGSHKTTVGFATLDNVAGSNTTTLITEKELNATTGAVAGGTTLSVARGDFAWDAAYDTAAERQFGPGTVFGFKSDQTGTTTTAVLPFMRFKFVSKDMGPI